MRHLKCLYSLLFLTTFIPNLCLAQGSEKGNGGDIATYESGKKILADQFMEGANDISVPLKQTGEEFAELVGPVVKQLQEFIKLLPEAFLENEKKENIIFGEGIRYIFTSKLPSLTNSQGQDLCQMSVTYHIPEEIKKVVRAACTIDKMTWVVKSEFDALEPLEKALLILHERLHNYKGVGNLHKATIAKITNGVRQLYIEKKRQEAKIYKPLDNKNLQTLTTYYKTLKGLGYYTHSVRPHRYGAGLVGEKVSVAADAFVSYDSIVNGKSLVIESGAKIISSRVYGDSYLKTGAEIINSKIGDSRVGSDAKIIDSWFLESIIVGDHSFLKNVSIKGNKYFFDFRAIIGNGTVISDSQFDTPQVNSAYRNRREALDWGIFDDPRQPQDFFIAEEVNSELFFNNSSVYSDMFDGLEKTIFRIGNNVTIKKSNFEGYLHLESDVQVEGSILNTRWGYTAIKDVLRLEGLRYGSGAIVLRAGAKALESKVYAGQIKLGRGAIIDDFESTRNTDFFINPHVHYPHWSEVILESEARLSNSNIAGSSIKLLEGVSITEANLDTVSQSESMRAADVGPLAERSTFKRDALIFGQSIAFQRKGVCRQSSQRSVWMVIVKKGQVITGTDQLSRQCRKFNRNY